MLINLYGGHHDELEVLCAPGDSRSLRYPGHALSHCPALLPLGLVALLCVLGELL